MTKAELANAILELGVVTVDQRLAIRELIKLRTPEWICRNQAGDLIMVGFFGPDDPRWTIDKNGIMWIVE